MPEVAVRRIDLSPPRHLAYEDRLPLGARVRFTHRAAVARWSKARISDGTLSRSAQWVLVEGVERGWRPTLGQLRREDIGGNPIEINELDIEFGFVVDPFYEREPAFGDPNKTVFVWPEEGEAYLLGLVRRGIGQSWSAYGGRGGMFDDSYEPGGFAARAFIHLYALKHVLDGVKYSLHPFWSVSLA